MAHDVVVARLCQQRNPVCYAMEAYASRDAHLIVFCWRLFDVATTWRRRSSMASAYSAFNMATCFRRHRGDINQHFCPQNNVRKPAYSVISVDCRH